MSDATDQGRAGYASLEDLTARMTPSERATWAAAKDADKTRAETLLMDASELIRARCAGATTAPARVLTAVTCRVVLRALRDRGSGDPDVASMTQTSGPFSTQLSWNNPGGELFLTSQDRNDINGSAQGGSGAFQVDLLSAHWRGINGLA